MAVVKYLQEGRPSPFGVKWSVDGKRKFKFFKTETLRNEFHAKLIAKEKKIGRSILELSASDAVIMSRCIDMLGSCEVVLEACREYQSNKFPVSGVAIAKAIEEYIQEKELLQQSPDHIKKVKIILEKFRFRFPDEFSDIDYELARTWALELNQMYVPITIRGHIKTASAFLNWCIKRNYIKENVFSGVPVPDVIMPEPEFLSVKDLQVLLETAKERYPRTVAYFALGAFAGLRSSAMARLEKEAFDFRNMGFLIRADQAKNKRRIYIDGHEENLWDWLKWARKHAPEGFDLRKGKWDKLKAKVAKLAEIKIPNNGLRHSFCSYHVALHGDAGKTATLLTHRGNVAVVYEHYKGNASKSEAEKYFKIKP